MHPTPPGLAFGIPFMCVLLSIALLPVVARHLWHRRMAEIMLLWIGALLLPYAMAYGAGAAGHLAWHAVLAEYLPFLTLLVGIYAVGGGILVEGGPWGTPAGNTILMAAATLLAGTIGPLAVSMVLIHPLLRANAHRRRKQHLVVFFIVLVCNVGGTVTPLGNPPLYIGLLQGVPFFWPLRVLLVPTLVLAVPLLAVFWALDHLLSAREPPAPARRRLHVRGLPSIGLLAVLVGAVLLQSAWHPGDVGIFGVAIGIEQLAGMVIFVLVTAIAARTTPLAVRQANMFTWAPMTEVATLFAAIFITIAPALLMLEAGRDGPLGPLLRLTIDAEGRNLPAAFFWMSGILSAFLDNAPTYMLFFHLAGGDPVQLTGPLAPTLMAMSAGSVCFGALTYIGNAPNLMVRGVAAHRGVRMPGFFSYLLYASILLLPGFCLLTVIWFL